MWLWSPGASAQEPTLQNAQLLMDAQQYEAAAKMYNSLLLKNDKELKANYGLGVALVESNIDVPEGVRRLKYVLLKGVLLDANFYLARGYQLGYEFELAATTYQKYLKSAKNTDLIARAQKYLAQCKASAPLANKIFILQVAEKTKMAAGEELSLYSPGKDVGTIGPNSVFFAEGVDPKEYYYQTERGDVVYFANRNAQGESDLFKMEQLIDGWSASEPLRALNTQANEKMPFLMIDGTTLYFSSDREGGMGGLDLYRATYDPDARTFLEPVNLGVPFNSPFDDFLFVADEFQKRAWFSSNRETRGDSTMVYEIVWDHSVIRNLVSGQAEIVVAAALPVDAHVTRTAAAPKGFTQTKRIGQKARLFNFAVNDSLNYGDWSDFKSDAARERYRKIHQQVLQCDSLEREMTKQRKIFQQSQSESLRNQAVNQILKTEKELYRLKSIVEQQEYLVRSEELDALRSAGINSNTPLSPTATGSTLPENLRELLIKEHFTFYTDVEFERQLKEWNIMYARLFDRADLTTLKNADSLFVWANILTLEASRVPERILKMSADTKGSEALKKGEETPEQLIEKAKVYKSTALRLYHYVLGQKNLVFREKIADITQGEVALDVSRLSELQGRSEAYFRQARDLAPYLEGINFAPYEKAGTLKREGVNLQTEALMIYLRHLDGMQKLPAKELIKNPAPAPAPEKAESHIAPVQAHKSNAATAQPETSGQLRYKVQLGLFRNAPAAKALEGLPEVSSVEVPERGASKYFCGTFATYNQAVDLIPKVRERGFEGAFVVAFYKGEQISLSKAKELEK